MVKFDAAARDIRVVAAFYPQGCMIGEAKSWLIESLIPRPYLAGQHQRLGTGARFSKATFHQQLIKTLIGRAHVKRGALGPCGEQHLATKGAQGHVHDVRGIQLSRLVLLRGRVMVDELVG